MNIKLLNIFDVNLYIYDRKNNLVKELFIPSNNIYVDIPYGVYKLIFTKGSVSLGRIIVYYHKKDMVVCFSVNNKNSNIRLFTLTDINYPGLGIEGGEIEIGN